jgi:hypothetical protein
MLTGCSSPASLKDLQGDLAMYNSTNSQFKLPTTSMLFMIETTSS